MKYDREWLTSIAETKSIIENFPSNRIPFPHRAVINQQFRAHKESFENDLLCGFNPEKAQHAILELAILAFELNEEHAVVYVE